MTLEHQPVVFDGTPEQRAANIATHQFGGEDGRCYACDSKPWYAAASYPCGTEPTYETVEVPDGQLGASILRFLTYAVVEAATGGDR